MYRVGRQTHLYYIILWFRDFQYHISHLFHIFPVLRFLFLHFQLRLRSTKCLPVNHLQFRQLAR